MYAIRKYIGFPLALIMGFSPLTASAITPVEASTNALKWLSVQQDVTVGTPSDGMVDSMEDFYANGAKQNKSYTYDQAVAAIAFIAKDERLRAEKVLSRMQAIQSPEGWWWNSYFWDQNNGGEEFRKHVGVVTWMAMAVMAYEKKYNDTRYRAMAEKALDWCLTYTKPNGGVAGGWSGWTNADEPWTSTEHNIDLYPVLLYFGQVSVDSARKANYNAKATGIKNFLDNQMWNDVTKQFKGGFKNDTQLDDPFLPMDVNPWGVLALGKTGTRDYQLSLDTVENANGNPGTLANPKYKHTLVYDGVNTMTAYDFDWRDDVTPAFTDNGEPNGTYGPDIWFEGSAFMSAAYYLRGNAVKADAIINEMIKKSDTRAGSSFGGIPYSLNGTNNSYWHMADVNCISSTGWVLLAIERFNPFQGAKMLIGDGDDIKPTAPTNLTAPTPTITAKSIALSWGPSSDASGIAGYRVYASGTNLMASTTGTGTTTTLTGLTEDTTYNLTVTGFDPALNESLASNSIAVRTLKDDGDITPPTKPTGLVLASPAQPTAVSLRWNASTDNVAVTGYDIFIDGVFKEETVGLGTSVTVTGLTPNKQYSFTVLAKDAKGNKSIVSDALSVTTPLVDITPPSTPTGLIKNGTEGMATVPLSWNASTDNVGVTGYNVYANGTIRAETTSETSVTVDGLTADTTYLFTVKAKDAAGNLSAASTSVSVTTKENPGFDFRQEVVKVGTAGTIAFKPLTAVTNVSVHYKLNGGAIQHFAMALDGATGVWEKGLTINSTDVIDYYFNYDKGGLTQTSIWYNYSAIILPPTDYSQNVTSVGNLAKISFTSNVSSTWVDVHYSINSGGLQNFRMTQSGSTWEKPNITLASGETLTYFFTYEKGNLAYDTSTNPMFSYIAP